MALVIHGRGLKGAVILQAGSQTFGAFVLEVKLTL